MREEVIREDDIREEVIRGEKRLYEKMLPGWVVLGTSSPTGFMKVSTSCFT